MRIYRLTRGYEEVPDPLRPARTVQKPVLVPVQVTSFVYSDAAGRHELEPDEDGGFEVPHEVGLAHCKFRTPEGEGWYPESAVATQRRLGRLQELPRREEPRRGPGRPPKGSAE